MRNNMYEEHYVCGALSQHLGNAISYLNRQFDLYAVLIWGHEQASTCNCAITQKMVERRRSFTLREKKAAVHVTEETNNCEAAWRIFVSEKLIRDRRKAEASGKWMGAHRNSRAIGRGAPPKFPELEKELLAWIDESRHVGKAVVVLGIRRKVLELEKEARFHISEGSFKASAMWCSRFMKRHDLSLRCHTTIAQRLPSDLESKLSGFHKLIIQKRRTFPYSL